MMQGKLEFNKEVALRVQLRGDELSISVAPEKGDEDENDSLEALGLILQMLKRYEVPLVTHARNTQSGDRADMIRVKCAPQWYHLKPRY